MINRIVGFAIKQRVAVLVMTVFLLGFGVWRATQLPMDAEPDVTNTQVIVSALDAGLGAGRAGTAGDVPAGIGAGRDAASGANRKHIAVWLVAGDVLFR